MYTYSRRCCLLRVVVDYIKVVYRRIKKCKSMVKSNNPKLQHTNLPKEYIFAWSMSEFIKLCTYLRLCILRERKNWCIGV